MDPGYRGKGPGKITKEKKQILFNKQMQESPKRTCGEKILVV